MSVVPVLLISKLRMGRGGGGGGGGGGRGGGGGGGGGGDEREARENKGEETTTTTTTKSQSNTTKRSHTYIHIHNTHCDPLVSFSIRRRKFASNGRKPGRSSRSRILSRRRERPLRVEQMICCRK